MNRVITHKHSVMKTSFFKRQIEHIIHGGISELLRKIRIIIHLIINYSNKHSIALLCIPFVILIRFLKPFIFIRFGFLKSNRIGHFAINTELYLCEKKNKVEKGKVFDFFYLKQPVSNRQLLKMWKHEKLKIYQIFKYIGMANRMLPGGKSHHLTLPGQFDSPDLFSKNGSSLYFTDTEKRKGMRFLESFNHLENGRFVCFLGRDPAYFRNFERNTKRLESSIHNYRNSDIENFVLAMKKLSKKGYYVFRMGSLVNKSLDIHDSKIIDYATNGMRSDFLDIFMSANCRFFVGTPSGLDNVASIFRVPILSVNTIPLEYTQTYLMNSIFIPKKLWLIDEKRFMTFEEIFQSGAGRFIHTDNYKELGLEVIENTSEEISDAVLEMEARVEGSWVEDRGDEKLQKRFWELFPRSGLHGTIRSRIGAAFLHQNIELIV